MDERHAALMRGFCPATKVAGNTYSSHGLLKVSYRVWQTLWLAYRVEWRCFHCELREEVAPGGLHWGF